MLTRVANELRCQVKELFENFNWGITCSRWNSSKQQFSLASRSWHVSPVTKTKQKTKTKKSFLKQSDFWGTRRAINIHGARGLLNDP
jgi:hypothetical protein